MFHTPETRAHDVSARDSLMGRPASDVWDPTGQRRPTLLETADHAGTPALGWKPGDHTPVLWDAASHLTIHSPHPERAPQLDHVALLVAVQLVRRHGTNAVRVIDASPATKDAPHHWRPLQDTGFRIYSVLSSPTTATAALLQATEPVDQPDRPRFVVILHASTLPLLLTAHGLHDYAATAREVLHRITETGAIAITTNEKSTAPTPTRSTLEAPHPEATSSTARAWTYRPAPGAPTPTEKVEIPGVLPPSWWGERLKMSPHQRR